MTSLDQTEQPSQSAAARSAYAPSPAPLCAVAGAAAEPIGDRSFPRPRATGDTATTPCAVTTANLQAGLALRLRAAYERGAPVGEMASACRRSVAETRALLALAGTDLTAAPGIAAGARESDGSREPAGGWEVVGRGYSAGRGEGDDRWGTVLDRVESAARPGPSPAEAGARGTPVAPAAPLLPGSREELVLATRVKRPSPARRLSRMHPHVGVQAEAAPRSPLPVEGPSPADASPAHAPASASAAPDNGTAAPDTAASETPLGILIVGTPNLPEPPSGAEPQLPVRVEAQLVRVGRGTSLLVLPAWREAIAVSVPTDQLLAATGLVFEDLPGTELSVLINPAAMHDRELDLRGWRTGAPGRTGPRGTRRGRA